MSDLRKTWQAPTKSEIGADVLTTIPIRLEGSANFRSYLENTVDQNVKSNDFSLEGPKRIEIKNPYIR